MPDHHHVHVAGDASAHRPERKKGIGGERWPIVAEDRFQQFGFEGFENELARVAPIERFAVAEEDFLHEAVDASRDDEVDPGRGVVPVPDGLHVAEHAGIGPVELLEFVQDQRERAAKGFAHQGVEELPEAAARSGNRHAERAFGFLLQLGAERRLRLARDRQVDIGQAAVVERPPHKGGLANASPSGQNRESGASARDLALAPKQRNLPFPAEERVHVQLFRSWCQAHE